VKSRRIGADAVTATTSGPRSGTNGTSRHRSADRVARQFGSTNGMQMTRTRRYAISAEEYQNRIAEEEMRAGILDLVTLKGGRLWATRDTRQSPELEDEPDLRIIVPPFAMLLELKSQDRGLTIGQRPVAELMRHVERVCCGVVRPVPAIGEYGYDELLDILRSI
jgi:hypothetical protein